MKTKIIYISGNEIFDMADIRAAFEEVRGALNLGSDTVLFGVPVDAEDAGFSTKPADKVTTSKETKPVEIETESVPTVEITETTTEIITEPVIEEPEIESVTEEQPVKKRGRPRKEPKVEAVIEETEFLVKEEPNVEEPIEQEKIVPILSVLATNEETVTDETPIEEEDIEIIPDISDDNVKNSVDTDETQTGDEEDEAGLEKLLSAMTPLQEDTPEEPFVDETNQKDESDSLDDNYVDATLEQLATEFAETQDKIAAESKSSSRSKIGKLRNILPFKQSKHKDSGLGDLFGWAGIAANDEDFSVPGFFTSAASKK